MTKYRITRRKICGGNIYRTRRRKNEEDEGPEEGYEKQEEE